MDATTGQAPSAMFDLVRAAEARLRDFPGWSQEQVAGAALAAACLIGDMPPAGFFAAGLAGAPGSGKTTLGRLVCDSCQHVGTPAIVLSLDDYYLPRERRQALADKHPLFAQRGVPGTHDWTRLVGDLDRLRAGDVEGLRLPRFDKSRDDRVESDAFRSVDAPPRVVIVEGWLVGAPPQPTESLLQAVNPMETQEDPDGRWRSMVNTQLARYHDDLASRLDRRWFLAVPDWTHVIDWRWQQERELQVENAGRHLADRAAVAGFLSQFERISRHMSATCREWADRVIPVDTQHVMRPG